MPSIDVDQREGDAELALKPTRLRRLRTANMSAADKGTKERIEPGEQCDGNRRDAGAFGESVVQPPVNAGNFHGPGKAGQSAAYGQRQRHYRYARSRIPPWRAGGWVLSDRVEPVSEGPEPQHQIDATTTVATERDRAGPSADASPPPASPKF